MSKQVYQNILDKKTKQQKAFAVLIDPDKLGGVDLQNTIDLAVQYKIDFIFVGGSLVVTDTLDQVVAQIKQACSIPVLLFPGSPDQITPKADALLYLSLISGRNPELLIGQHVISAPFVKQSGLEIIPVGYMLIDGGMPTTVSYISNTNPIPANKNDIAACTAMAGEMLGLKLLYMDAGSGAKTPITEQMIHSVSTQTSIPLVIGGGIRDAEKAYRNCKAGADLIVVGNAIEKDPQLIKEISEAIHSCSGVPQI